MTFPLPTAHRPAAFPRLTRDEARARTLIAHRAQGCKVTLGNAQWSLFVEPLADSAVTEFGPGDWCVRGLWSGARFEARLPETAMDLWIAAEFPSMDLPGLPAAIRNAAFDSALREALAALEGAGFGRVRVDSVDAVGERVDFHPRPASHLPHRFGLALVRGEVTLWASFSTETLGLLLMGGMAERASPTVTRLAREDVPVTLRAEVGTATLSRAELLGLVPGDAIVVGENWVGPDRQIDLGNRRVRVRVRLDGGRLTVIDAFDPKEIQMDSDDEVETESVDSHGSDDDALVGVDSLPIRIQFDLGQRTMQLGDVIRLQPGEFIDLDRPVGSTVNIRANGALIGKGELIDVAGRLAVSITSMGAQELESGDALA